MIFIYGRRTQLILFLEIQYIYDTNAKRTSRCCTFPINLSAGKIITDNFVCDMYEISYYFLWLGGRMSFILLFFFSLKNISSIRCNCTQYKYNNMKSVHNSSEKKAAFHQIAISISCKKTRGNIKNQDQFHCLHLVYYL